MDSHMKHVDMIKAIKDIYIDLPTNKHCLDIVDQQMSLKNHDYLVDSILVTGDSGLGKSTIIGELTKKYPNKAELFALGKRDHVPLITLNMPVNASPRILAAEIIKKYGDPIWKTGTLNVFNHLLQQYVTESRTQMIVIDEFHHLFGVCSMRNGTPNLPIRGIHDWIKNFMEETKVPFLIAGLPQCNDLMRFDPQFARRFKKRFRLSHFSMETELTRKAYTNFLTRFWKEITNLDIGINDIVDFGGESPEYLARLHAATSGNPDKIKELHISACLNALESGRDRVLIEDFEIGYMPDDGATLDEKEFPFIGNPFKAPIHQVKSHINLLPLAA